MTVQDAKKLGKQKLVNSSSPVLDVECLLQSVLHLDKTQLLFNRDKVLTQKEQEQFEAFLSARSTGLPVAYITGVKEFFGYDFFVTPDVLIPKPDTEVLVEKAIEIVKQKMQSNDSRILTICDMCTGSGCVGLSILRYCFDSNIVPAAKLPAVKLVDISSNALNIAHQNAKLIPSDLVRSKVSFSQSNLFQNVAGTFDIIVANPPYIPDYEVEELLKDGRSEPALALVGDIDLFGNPTGEHDGLGIIRNLVPQAVAHLAPNGVLLIESGEYNAEMTEYIFYSAGLTQTCIYKDLSGQLRVTSGRK